MNFLNWFETYPRRLYAALCAACLAMLAFGLYLQHVVGLNPCPMCIVQRYSLLVVAILAGLTALSGRRPAHLVGAGVAIRSRFRSLHRGAPELAAVESARGGELRARLLRDDRTFPCSACYP